MYHHYTIQNSPLQTYVSALIFSPGDSLIKQNFQDEEPKWATIKQSTVNEWSSCIATLEGHALHVCSVAFSHDSTRLVSVSTYSGIKIWDANSGGCLVTIDDRSYKPHPVSVALSPDSTRLAGVSMYAPFKIWDTNSGECLVKFEDHPHRSRFDRTVVFSPDLTRVAISPSQVAIHFTSGMLAMGSPSR